MEIQDYPNYLIYEDGRVFSKKSNIFLKPQKNYDGYFQVNLWKNNKRKRHSIHRLIALYYIPNPGNKPCVDHINRQRDDNNINNLRWVTPSENQQNTIVRKNNKTTGIKNIYYEERQDRYRFNKTINGVIHQKDFKTLEEAIVYKYNYLEDLTSAPVDANA